MDRLTEEQARLFLEPNFGWVAAHDGALEHIDRLQLKDVGRSPYPLPEGEQRVIVRVRSKRVLSRIG